MSMQVQHSKLTGLPLGVLQAEHHQGQWEHWLYVSGQGSAAEPAQQVQQAEQGRLS